MKYEIAVTQCCRLDIAGVSSERQRGAKDR